MKKATETRGSFDLTAEALAVLIDANADVLLGLRALRISRGSRDDRGEEIPVGSTGVEQ